MWIKNRMALATFVALSASWSVAAKAEEQGEIAKELDALKMQVEALATALEGQDTGSASKTTLGGYGEHHYNMLSGDGSYSDKDQIDAHRYVLFINHEYSDDLKFFSEFELEHSLAGEGKPGEVELEQAFIQKTLTNGNRVSIGQFLIPVGFLNETHEPDTFYGVERNNMEKNIIPTTWWESGLMYSGNAERFSYDVALHSGLKALVDSDDDGASDAFSSVRSGRQKSAEADGKELAVTARVKGLVTDNINLGLTLQRQNDVSGSFGEGIDATLVEVNASWQMNAWSAKALYAQWDINEDIETISAGSSEQNGLSAELAYKVRENLGVFTRYSEWDNKAADSAESGFDQMDVGVNYWMAPRVVLKADYQVQTKKSDDSELAGINLGAGWSF